MSITNNKKCRMKKPKIITKREGTTGDAWSALFGDKHENCVTALAGFFLKNILRTFQPKILIALICRWKIILTDE